MKKNAEITTTQLVTIIILIVSFAVILFFIFKLNLGETTNKEICHNSVVLKGQSELVSGPLDCKTNYLCISGGGECEEINPSSTVEIEASNKDEFMEALAEEMSDCWFTFGEGKIDYAGIAVGNKEKASCAICSIMAFDSEIGSVSHQEFYDYLRTTKKSDSQTYLQYLYSVNSLEDFEQEFYLKDYLTERLESSKTYFILTGMVKEGWFTPRWNILRRLKSDHLQVTILEKTKENYDAVGCEEFLTKA